MCRLLRFWWSYELAVPHLIETWNMSFVYIFGCSAKSSTNLPSLTSNSWKYNMFGLKVESPSVCWSFVNDPLLLATTSYIHLPSILFLRACTDMVVSSLLFLLQSLGLDGCDRFLDDFVVLTQKLLEENTHFSRFNKWVSKPNASKHEFTISLSAHGTCVSVL